MEELLTGAQRSPVTAEDDAHGDFDRETGHRICATEKITTLSVLASMRWAGRVGRQSFRQSLDPGRGEGAREKAGLHVILSANGCSAPKVS